MIPVRVRIAGFLSYREPQEFDFGSAPLWLLAGPNSSGKSALFDAITWVLYGQHRGGSAGGGELLNKHSDFGDVLLEVRIGSEHCLLERSLKRGRSSVSTGYAIRRRDGPDWIDVPGTTRKADFDAWIQDKLRMDSATFTASTLLRQGHADDLLNAAPKARAEVLANLVHLERWQELHAKATQERLKAKAILDALAVQTQFNVVPSEAQVAAAMNGLMQAESNAESARGRVIECEQRLDQARRAMLLKERAEEAREKCTRAERLLSASVTIETEFARLQELAVILPAAETVVVTRGRVTESEHRTERFARQQAAAQQVQKASENALQIAKDQRRELATALAEVEAKLQALAPRLRTLASALATVKLLEEQNAECARLQQELERFPPGLAEQVMAARREVERLQSLGRELPIARRLHEEQVLRDEAALRKQALTSECETIRHNGESARTNHDAIARRLQEARNELSACETALAAAEAQAKLAQEAVESVLKLKSSSTCHFCGSPLTENQIALETRRREEHLAATDAAATAARELVEEATAKWQAVARDDAASQERLNQLRQDYRDRAAMLAETTRQIERHDRAIAEAKAALSGAISVLSLSELEEQFQQLAGGEQHLRRVQEQAAAQSSLSQQLSGAKLARDRLAAQVPAGTADGLLSEHAAKLAEETALTAAIRTQKKAIDEVDREIEKHARLAHESLTEFTDLNGRLRTEEATREQSRETIARAVARLPDDWKQRIEAAGLGDLNAWKDEHTALTANRVAVTYRQLDAARAQREELREDAERREAEWRSAETVTIDEAATQLTAARTAVVAIESVAAAARNACRRIEEQQTEFQRLNRQAQAAERSLARWKRNCDLLGRDGIQRLLVREAERAIVAHANETLAKLDGGLVVTLAEDGEAEKALELKAVCPASGDEPVGVVFLSGGQRFRVSVALALAFGRFASDRASHCLMIDEGFGGLDATGRAAIIRELHELKLPRILVISPDGEFANSFENIYRFELKDGATRVNHTAASDTRG